MGLLRVTQVVRALKMRGSGGRSLIPNLINTPSSLTTMSRRLYLGSASLLISYPYTLPTHIVGS